MKCYSYSFSNMELETSSGRKVVAKHCSLWTLGGHHDSVYCSNVYIPIQMHYNIIYTHCSMFCMAWSLCSVGLWYVLR